MAWGRYMRAAAAGGVVVALAVALLVLPVPDDVPARADARLIAESMSQASTQTLARTYLPAKLAAMSPGEAAAAVAKDPVQAAERAAAVPDVDAAGAGEAGLAQLKTILDSGGDPRAVAAVYRDLPKQATRWLPVLFPGVVGNLTGAALSDRIAANRINAAAAVEGSRALPWPKRPWSEQPRKERRDLSHLLDPGRQLIYLDQTANDRLGSWVEVRGDLDTAEHVAVLVPGGGAFLASGNFGRYSARADSFTEAADGELAVIVWAAAQSPVGWIEESDPSWTTKAAPELADFLHDLNRQLRSEVSLTVAGHSYGGAVVGVAETIGFDADRVLHVASAGSGFAVTGPGDYTQPCRERFTIMAPGDPIGYFQNIPQTTGLGHGVAAGDLAGAVRLSTGYLPDDPDAEDDVGRSLGSQGIAGKRIAGIHAHSEVFIPDSGAWRNMLDVFSLDDPRRASKQPPPNPQC